MENPQIVVNVVNENLDLIYKLHFNKKVGGIDFEFKDVNTKKTNIYCNIPVFSIDSILDFSKKISVFSEVDYFKQYLCFSDDYCPITHKAELYGNNIIINIKDILLSNNKVSNINIDLNFYENKNSIKITDLASFTLLNEIFCNKKQPIEITMVSMDYFINSQLNNLNVPTYQELYYYGCGVKYWPMLSYDAYIIYLLQNSDFYNSFPLLSISKSDLNYKYELEAKLLNEIKLEEVNFYNYTKKDNLTLQINNLVLENKNVINNYNLRIMFDILHVNEKVQLILLKTTFNEKITYVYKMHTIPSSEYILEMEELIQIFKESLGSSYIYIVYKLENILIVLKIYDNNVHELHCKLYNNVSYNINEIIELCKLTINNEFKTIATVFSDVNKVFEYDITTISVYLNWGKNIDITLFSLILDYYANYIKLGLIKNESDEKNSYLNLNYYKGIKGGTNNVLDVLNEFDYLSNLKSYTNWTKFINTGQRVSIFYLFNQIQFELVNITPHNFNTIYSFIKFFTIDFINKYKSTDILKHSQSLSLKSLDPNLYNDLLGDRLYSRICQKKYQPEMVLDISSLQPNEKLKYIKYYNFTTKAPVYYTCPNKEYSHFSFITDIHSHNYCVPCCKKKSNFNKNIYNECLKKHVFIESPDIIKKSRYIINFGKNVEYKRLGQLPYILWQYFNEYNKTILTTNIDNKFVYNDAEYDVATIIQNNPTSIININKLMHYLNTSNNDEPPILNIIMEPSINMYLFSIIKNILIQPLILLQRGTDYVLLWHPYMLAKYYLSGYEKIPVIIINKMLESRAMVGGNEPTKNGMYLYGNAQYLNNINVAIFYCLAIATNLSFENLISEILNTITKDVINIINTQYNCDIIKELSSIAEHQSLLPWNKIAIDIAYYLYKINAVIFYYHENSFCVKLPAREMYDYPLMLIFKKTESLKSYLHINYYYLVAYCVLKKYFKTQNVDQALFYPDSSIYSTVISLLNYININNNNFIFFTFINNNNCELVQYYTNKNGYYYMALIKWNNYSILFPLFFQLKGNSITKVHKRSESNIPNDELVKFLNLFNDFLEKNNIISLNFSVQNYIQYNKKFIGLVSANMYFYFKPCTEVPSKFSNPIVLKYDPDEINEIIISTKQNLNISANLSQYYYKNYLYYLFCIQIVFNTDITKIKSIENLEKFFHIDDNFKLTQDFPNIMLSCISKMPYCNNNKLIISQKDFKYYSNLFINELTNGKIYKNKLLAFLLNNFFQFSKNNNEKIFIEFVE